MEPASEERYSDGLKAFYRARSKQQPTPEGSAVKSAPVPAPGAVTEVQPLILLLKLLRPLEQGPLTIRALRDASRLELIEFASTLSYAVELHAIQADGWKDDDQLQLAPDGVALLSA